MRYLPPPLAHYPQEALNETPPSSLCRLRQHYEEALEQLSSEVLGQLKQWPETRKRFSKQKRISALYRDKSRLRYRGPLPPGHDGLGLGLLGVSGEQLLPRETYAQIRADVLSRIRGTVQADILKEDQAQNECIFATDFGLRLMGDIQAYFIAHHIRNYYSVSISGYHIAEAGANPITQLVFTLANGFTLVEYYLARGMAIDDFAPHMSFFLVMSSIQNMQCWDGWPDAFGPAPCGNATEQPSEAKS